MSDEVDSDRLLSRLSKGGSLLFVAVAFELGLSFVAKLLIAPYLGPVDYGAVSLGIVTMSLGTTVALSGLYTGIGRYLPRYDDVTERRGVLVSGFQLGVTMTVAAGAGVAIAAPWIAAQVFHDPTVGPVLRVFGLVIPLAAFVRLSLGAVQGMQHSLPKVYIEHLTLPTVRFLGLVVVVVFGLSTVDVAMAYLIAYLAAAVLGLVYLVRRTPLFSMGVRYVSKHRELVAFSAPLFVSSSMMYVLAQTDTLLLGYFSATGDVGIYNVVYPIAQLLTVGLTSVGFLFMPIISQLHSEGAHHEMRRFYQTATKWLFAGTLPLFLVFALFPTMTLKITFGPQYLGGASSLSVLAAGFFVHAVLGPNANTLTSMGRTRTIMYISTAMAALNIVLNLWLIPRFSFYGAAVATTISYIALNLAYSCRLYRETGIHPFTRSLVIPGLIGLVTVSVIYTIVMTYFTVTVPVLIAFFVVFLGLYAVALVRFGIDREEVMLVLRFEDRYDVDLGPIKVLARRLMR